MHRAWRKLSAESLCFAFLVTRGTLPGQQHLPLSPPPPAPAADPAPLGPPTGVRPAPPGRKAPPPLPAAAEGRPCSARASLAFPARPGRTDSREAAAMGLPALLCALAVLSCPISPPAAAARTGESRGRRSAGCLEAGGSSARLDSVVQPDWAGGGRARSLRRPEALRWVCSCGVVAKT